ncbi:transporter (plasmid) [Fulvitalea axinellae]|uniref:Transporter n=1 Tax=Fulvitalea axinellae TaxID=1182444 RepID=A0AAU9CYE5_9BACT|nr:transporter [Fulvitalea axinellae]
MKKILIIAIICASSLTRAVSQTQAPSSLRDCLKIALERSHSVAKAELETEKAEQKIKETLSSGLPQIEGQASVINNLRVPVTMMPGELVGASGVVPVAMGTKYTGEAYAQATQLLYSHDFWIGVKASKKAKELYKIQKARTVEEVIYQIAGAYYKWLRFGDQADALKDNIEKMEKVIKAQHGFTQQGLAHKLDENRLKVKLSNLNVSRNELLTAEATQLNLIKLYMGLRTTESLNLQKEPMGAEGLVLQPLLDEPDFSKRPDIRLLKKQFELKELEKQSIAAKYYPSLVAVGNLKTQAQREEFNIFGDRKWFSSSFVGIQLNIPIFDGMKKRAQSKQVKIEIEQLGHDLQFAGQSANVEIQNAKRQLRDAYQNVLAQKENLRLAEDVFTQTEARYKAQVASLTDLLNAEVTLRESQNSLYSQNLKLKEAGLDVLKAEGRLTTLVETP